jgi:hypothetical protein
MLSEPSLPTRFVAVGSDVYLGQKRIALCLTKNMAKRVANALNAYTPDRRGQ